MLNILYEDNHLLVVDKPAGLLTQPSGTEEDSIEEQAKAFLAKKYEKKGAVYLHAVHRLDKPVSGIVLFAKSSKALSRLQEAIRDRKIRKVYVAEVAGSVPEDRGTLSHYLLHGDHQAEVCEEKTPGAKLAILFYQVLKRKEKTTLLEIDLETGRYHQIRAQMSAWGHPIVGDQKYQGPSSSRVHLHHAKMEFYHPTTKELLSFTSEATFV